jgi:hypothetical protein
MHGEKLARINRWEYSLEHALDGDPPGQPVFVAMATTDRDRPWDRDALDTIGAAARHVALETDLVAAAPSLVRGLFEALIEQHPSSNLTSVISELFFGFPRSGSPQQANRDLSPETATTTRPSSRFSDEQANRPSLELAMPLPQGEIARLPRCWRRFLGFLYRAGTRIRLREPGSEKPMGLLTRLELLVGAFLGG